MRLDARPARAACTRGRSDEAALDQVVEWVLTDGGQPRNRLAAASNHDLDALLDLLEMLAQPIVKIAHPYLISLAM